ncbi:hypothetical protein [Haladaptatus sp. NG-WS-4]
MAKVLNSDRYVVAEKVAIVHVDNRFGEGLAETIDAEVSGDVVATIPLPPRRETYARRIREVLQSGADAVAFASEPGNTRILELLSKQSYDSEYVLSAGLVPSEILPHMEGMYSASVASTSTSGGTSR